MSPLNLNFSVFPSFSKRLSFSMSHCEFFCWKIPSVQIPEDWLEEREWKSWLRTISWKRNCHSKTFISEINFLNNAAIPTKIAHHCFSFDPKYCGNKSFQPIRFFYICSIRRNKFKNILFRFDIYAHKYFMFIYIYL